MFHKSFLNCWLLLMVTVFIGGELTFLNSSVILSISGPATIHRCSTPGFSVSPTAPPDPLMTALFCSRQWSVAVAEDLLLVLHNKLPCFEFFQDCWVFLIENHHVMNVH